MNSESFRLERKKNPKRNTVTTTTTTTKQQTNKQTKQKHKTKQKKPQNTLNKKPHIVTSLVVEKIPMTMTRVFLNKT